MSVTHIKNLFEAIVFLVENQKNKSDVYNVTDPDITTMIDIYNLLQIKF